MGISKYSLLITLYAILVKGNRHYIVPSMDKILALLEKYHGIKIKRRWLFECMRYLKDAGLIKTRYRFKYCSAKGVRQIPSMITITLLGFSFLSKKDVKGAIEKLKIVLNWLKEKDGRFPTWQEFSPQIDEITVERNKGRLKALLEPIG